MSEETFEQLGVEERRELAKSLQDPQLRIFEICFKAVSPPFASSFRTISSPMSSLFRVSYPSFPAVRSPQLSLLFIIVGDHSPEIGVIERARSPTDVPKRDCCVHSDERMELTEKNKARQMDQIASISQNTLSSRLVPRIAPWSWSLFRILYRSIHMR